MANIYGIELDNPTANTVVVNLFQLGASGSSKIINSVLAESVTTEFPIPTFEAGASATYPFYFVGDTTAIIANEGVFFNVSPSDVKLSITSFTSNGGLRQIEYYDSTTVTITQTVNYSLIDLSNDIESNFSTVNSALLQTNINAIPLVKWDGASLVLKLKFESVYKGNTQLVLSSNQLFNIYFETGFTTYTYSFPDNVGYATDWRPIYQTTNGILVDGSTGADYGEFARSQTGEPIAINSLRITPLTSGTYDENERISQLLQPIKFTRVDSNGKSNTYCLNPSVDLYQYMTTLDYINLGTKTDDFPLDGNTNFSYQLLPYAKVNIQLDYVQTSNFVFANQELVKEIVELNKKKNKEVQLRSKIAKEYTLHIK